jgi:tetratricopeptide (TPR) repeat protein
MSRKAHKKGLRASRERLEMAMLDAGIKTQAALAERIAELENLACPPKDSVNRVFRGESVSPKSIARIAKVLQVEPQQLYETEPDPQESGNPVQPALNQPLFGSYSLVVLRMTDNIHQLARALQQQAGKLLRVTIVDACNFDSHFLSIDIARRYQSHGVLTLRAREIDRYVAVQAFLYFDGVERLVWTTGITRSELEQLNHHLADQCLKSVKDFLNQNPATPAPISVESQEKYLQARLLLEEYQSEKNIKRSQGLLQAALGKHPEFASANAAMAESLIGESWRSDTRLLLEEAQQYCDRALRLEPDNIYAQMVQSQLCRVTGRVAEAIRLCQECLEAFPGNIEALNNLAQAWLESFIQGDEQSRDYAISAAREATEIEPSHWRHHFELGNILFLTGQSLAALPAYRTSVLLRPNERAYINMGTVELCQGQLEEAHRNFLMAQELAPDSYLGMEYLGNIHFYQGNYLAAIEHRHRAMELFAEPDNVAIHQMWGNLGDACRLGDKPEMAADSYRKALEIIDRDHLQGYHSPAFTVYRYFYRVQLGRYIPERFPPENLTEVCDDLATLIGQEMPPGAHARLAHLLLMENRREEAALALEHAAAICPLFLQHPDLCDLSQPPPIQTGEPLQNNR